MLECTLTRYNQENQVIALDSREYGYLVVELVNKGSGNLLPASCPIRIQFVPDAKLSINQIMEFKKLEGEMRLPLCGQLDSQDMLKLSYHPPTSTQETAQMVFCLQHFNSAMEVEISSDDFSGILAFLDDLCVVVSTNTFFKLDLVEISKNVNQNLQTKARDLKMYLSGFIPK